MKVLNKRTEREIADNLAIAENIFSRMKGLLGKKNMNSGEALWIRPCNAIHTFCMKFPIDVIFLDKEHKVVGFAENLEPYRLTKIFFSASSVIELPAGVIGSSSTKIGDQLEIY